MAVAGAHRIARDDKLDGTAVALPVEGLLILAHKLFSRIRLHPIRQFCLAPDLRACPYQREERQSPREPVAMSTPDGRRRARRCRIAQAPTVSNGVGRAVASG